MKKYFVFFALFLVAAFVLSGSGLTLDTVKKSGETLFMENCSPCHPDGGNIINPQKTLMKKDREANKIKTPADIIKIMRNPGPGMTKFDEKTISNADAKKIAGHILRTFK